MSGLQFSEYISNNEKKEGETKIEEIKRTRKNKTRRNPSSSLMHQLKNIQSNAGEEDDLAPYPPKEFPPQPSSAAMERRDYASDQIEAADDGATTAQDLEEDPAVENFSQVPDTYARKYYQQYVPYFTNMSAQGTVANRDELVEKLNYMIHLLEEQQDEKTSNVTEELILYCFLGVFMIFVVDSFSRGCKYTR